MSEQAGMRIGARLQGVSPFDAREPLDETEESVDVATAERRHRHGPVDPLDDEHNPVTVVEHTDELWSRGVLVETGEDLSLSAMHLGRHGVEFRAGRLDEDDSSIRQRASGRGPGENPPSRLTASTTGEPAISSIAARTSSGMSFHAERTPCRPIWTSKHIRAARQT